MSRSAGIRSLEAAVRRLEAAAGKGQRYCAFCRYVPRDRWPGPKVQTPRPEELLKAECEFCRSEYTVNLAGFPEDERELWRLYFSFTMEDRYTDPKAHALILWWDLRQERKESRGRGVVARGRVRSDPKARAGAKLYEEVGGLIDRKSKKLRAKYGDPFPEHTRLIESVRNREKRKLTVAVPGLSDLVREETHRLIRAELEKIIWGETRPETASAIKRIGREIDELIRTAQEEEERRRKA